MCIITATAVTAVGVSSTIAAGVATAANVALAVGAVATVASTALGVVGSIQSGKAKQAQYNYQAKVNEQNAQIAKDNAAMERQAGLEEARRKRVQTLQAIGNQKVGLAANGVDIGYGSSLDILEDTAEFGELDALMLQTEGERRALNYEIQGTNFQNEANMAYLAGANARKAGKIDAMASGFGAIGDIGLKIGGSFMGGGSSLGSSAAKSTGTKLSGGFGLRNKDILRSTNSGLLA